MTKTQLTRVGEITEKTVLPVSLILVLIGGIVWLTNIYAQGNSNADAISELKRKQDEYNRVVQSIDSRLSRIEGSLNK